MGDSVIAAYRRYAKFSGRATRSEFWWFELALVLFLCSAVFVGESTLLTWVWTAVIISSLIPNIALIVRRLHDTGRSGWWYAATYIPVVGVLLVVYFLCLRSGPDNRYGPRREV